MSEVLMEIIHRIAFNSNTKPELRKLLDQLGISYTVTPFPHQPPGTGSVHFDISESDPVWPRLRESLERWPVSDVYDTLFTEEEILAAEWVRLVPVYEKEYLKPGNLAWRDYLFKGRCPNCGAGRQQKAPIRLSKEPERPLKYVVSPIASYFMLCSPEMIAEMEDAGIKGYEVWPVLQHRTSEPFAHTVQVYIPEVANPGLMWAEGLSPTHCEVCGRTKYRPHMRGVMYFRQGAFEGKEGIDILLSYEWFGSGRAAYREIIISNRLARLILEKSWKGVRMKVIEVVQPPA